MSHLHHRISALVDGELSAAARAKALAHLDRCDACRSETASVLSVKRALRGLAPVRPSDDLTRALAEVTPSSTSSPVPPRPGRHRLVAKGLVGAGAATGALLVTAYAVGDSDQPPAIQPDVDAAVMGYAALSGGEAFVDPVPTGDGRPVPLQPIADGRPRGHEAVHGWGRAEAARLLTWSARSDQTYAVRGIRTIDLWDFGARARFGIEHVPTAGTLVSTHSDSAGVTAAFASATSPVADESLDERTLPVLLSTYDVSVAGPCVVAGRACTAVQATHDSELVARFLIDNETGVLLGREHYVDGQLQRDSSFESLHVSRQGFLEHVAPVLHDRAATPVPASHTGTLADAGWTCPSRVGPYRLVRADAVDAGGDRATRLIYSDGVALVAVTEQRGRLDSAALEGFTRRVGAGGRVAWVREGFPTVVVFEDADMVYTLVTSAPDTVARDVAGGLDDAQEERQEPNRLGRGLDRMAGAVWPG